MILFINACVRKESRTLRLSTGLDIIGADQEQILQASMKEIAGMNGRKQVTAAWERSANATLPG